MSRKKVESNGDLNGKTKIWVAVARIDERVQSIDEKLNNIDKRHSDFMNLLQKHEKRLTEHETWIDDHKIYHKNLPLRMVGGIGSIGALLGSALAYFTTTILKIK